jgi:hypothetical protein
LFLNEELFTFMPDSEARKRKERKGRERKLKE